LRFLFVSAELLHLVFGRRVRQLRLRRGRQEPQHPVQQPAFQARSLSARTVDYDPVIKSKLTCSQLILGPSVVYIWSRNPPKIEATTPSKSTVLNCGSCVPRQDQGLQCSKEKSSTCPQLHFFFSTKCCLRTNTYFSLIVLWRNLALYKTLIPKRWLLRV